MIELQDADARCLTRCLKIDYSGMSRHVSKLADDSESPPQHQSRPFQNFYDHRNSRFALHHVSRPFSTATMAQGAAKKSTNPNAGKKNKRYLTLSLSPLPPRLNTHTRMTGQPPSHPNASGPASSRPRNKSSSRRRSSSRNTRRA